MANGNLGSYAVSLPNVFQAPGQALQSATEQVQRQGENLAQMQMRQQEIAERKAERDEAQLYRKMQTIQELSDLSKYQTANDVANAIGNKNAFEIRKKYIDLARQGKVNDADIFEGINKEIASTAQGMNALKAEGENFENELKNLKQIMPKLDAPRLLRDYRKDVVNRRIEDGVSFKNPLEVQQSEFATNLLDPDNLSDYLTDISDLEKQVVSPKSVKEMNLAVGSSKDFVPFEGKVPFFAEAVLPEGYIEGDYLPKGFVPETRVKSEIIPEIKKLTGLDFKVVPDDVYNNFADDPIGKTNVIALAKQKFPTYKNFTPVEKYNAQKNALYDYITQKNVSGFTSKERKVKSDTNVNIPKEEKGLEGLNWVKNFTSAVDSKNINSAIGEARKLFAGAGGKYEFKDLKIAPDGGMSFEYYPMIDGIPAKEEVLREKISPTDPNKNYKIANLYQKITGQDVKMERKILGGKDDLSNQKPVLYILNGKKYMIPSGDVKEFLKDNPNAKRG
jgi:hypothetical protein